VGNAEAAGCNEHVGKESECKGVETATCEHVVERVSARS
jgi:hypothetical protein